jgi:hypothetical protein
VVGRGRIDRRDREKEVGLDSGGERVKGYSKGGFETGEM